MTIKKEIYEKHVIDVGAGRIIFSEGEAGTSMYVVIDGEVEISKRTSMDTSKTLITLRKGDIFGEMALIDQKARSATAIAAKASRLLVMDEALFVSMIEKNPDFAKKMIKILTERIRKSNATIQELATMNREGIILAGVAEYAADHGIDSIKGKRVPKDKFVMWAESHLGMTSHDIYVEMERMLQKRSLIAGANSGELLVTN